jgi:hypothetical protein
LGRLGVFSNDSGSVSFHDDQPVAFAFNADIYRFAFVKFQSELVSDRLEMGFSIPGELYPQVVVNFKPILGQDPSDLSQFVNVWRPLTSFKQADCVATKFRCIRKLFLGHFLRGSGVKREPPCLSYFLAEPCFPINDHECCQNYSN